MVREAICVAQTWLGGVHDTGQAERASRTLGRLIEDIDRQRPLGPDGKHDDRHTATCGCEDGELVSGLRITVEGAAAGLPSPLFMPGDTITITDLVTGDGKLRRYRVVEPLDSATRIVPEEG